MQSAGKFAASALQKPFFLLSFPECPKEDICNAKEKLDLLAKLDFVTQKKKKKKKQLAAELAPLHL